MLQTVAPCRKTISEETAGRRIGPLPLSSAASVSGAGGGHADRIVDSDHVGGGRLCRDAAAGSDRVGLRFQGWKTAILGAITNFFDTLGIGSFAPTMAWFKLRKLVPDRLIPCTMLVGHTPPTLAAGGDLPDPAWGQRRPGAPDRLHFRCPVRRPAGRADGRQDQGVDRPAGRRLRADCGRGRSTR